MKKKKIILILSTLLVLSLTGCGGKKGNEFEAKAVFMLEEGYCKNNHDKVTYVYPLANAEATTLIVDPNTIEVKSEITKAGYSLLGWYQEKNVSEDGEVTYDKLWDFKADKISIDGVTLYAKWEKDTVYSFDLYSKDDEGKETLLKSYPAQEGEEFSDYQHAADKTGYTITGYYDEEGNELPTGYTHPGKDTTSVKVYVQYVEGNYAVVSDYDTLIKSKTKNIYLKEDIDCEGKPLGFANYSKIFMGNNHKISNFKLQYSTDLERNLIDETDTGYSYLYIGLFNTLNKAKLENVTFENMAIDVNVKFSKLKGVYVTPLMKQSIDSTIDNVHLTGSITIASTVTYEVEINPNKTIYSKDDKTIETNTSAEFVVTDNRNL